MANFCYKCGSGIDQSTGLCPICDAEKINAMKSAPKFCGRCGSKTDPNTGLCPNCSPAAVTTATPTEPLTDTEPAFSAEVEPEVTDEKIITEEIVTEETVTEETVTEEIAAEEPLNEEIVESFVTANAVEEAVEEVPAQELPNEQFDQTVSDYSVPLTTYTNVAVPAAVMTEQPVFEQQVPEQNGPKLPEKRKTSAVTVISTILLALCFFITSVIALALFDARNAVKSENSEKLLKNVKISEVFDKTGEDSALNAYVDDLRDSMAEIFDTEIAEEDIAKFIDKSTFTDFAAEKSATFFEDFINDDDAEFTISDNECYDILKDNKKLIEKEFDVDVSDRQIDNVVSTVFEDEDEIEFFSSSKFEDDTPTLYNLVRVGMSTPLMIIFLCLTLLFAGLMFWNSWSQALSGIGINLIIIGSLTGICAMIAGWFTPIWDSIFKSNIIATVVGNALAVNGLVSLILFVSGILLLVIRTLILKLCYKIQYNKLNRA